MEGGLSEQFLSAVAQHRLGAKTQELVNAHVDRVAIAAAGPDKIVMDAHTIQAIQQLGFKIGRSLDPKYLPTAAEVLNTIEKRIKAKCEGDGVHPVYESLAKRLDDLRKHKMAEAQGSIEFLKKILELAKDVTVAVNAEEEGRLDDLTPGLLPDPNMGALTQIFDEYAPNATPVIIERLVHDIDQIVRGDRDIRRELRRTMHKQGITDDAVYDRAYAYVREHY